MITKTQVIKQHNAMGWLDYTIKIAVFTIAYVLFGRLGQMIALHQVTAIWAPSGISLAILLLFGYGMWPVIFLGSFVINFWYASSPIAGISTFFSSIEIGIGSTLAIVLSMYLIQTYSSYQKIATATFDTVIFLLVGFFCPVIAALIGGTALMMAKLIPSQDFFQVCFTWWIGDVIGIILVAPFILVWFQTQWHDLKASQLLTLFIHIVAISSITLAISRYELPVEYLLIPCIVFTCFRTGSTGTVSITLLIAVITIWETIHGYGFFIGEPRDEALLLLQTFIGSIVIIGLILCAVLEERKKQAVKLIRMMNETHKAWLEAKSANTAKNVFFAKIGHELRTPLNHIIGYSELLQEIMEEKKLNDLLPDISKIKQSAQDLLSIISQILDLAKLEADKMELTLESFSLTSLIETIKHSIQPIASKNRNSLQFNLQNNLGDIYADKQKVGDIFFHILDNACKFTSNGEINCTITREKPSGTEAEKIIFSVRDKGTGMTNEQITQLFQPFVNIEVLPKEYLSGLGLGLAITKRYCEMMNGDIAVTSTPKEGTIFIVKLPVKVIC